MKLFRRAALMFWLKKKFFLVTLSPQRVFQPLPAFVIRGFAGAFSEVQAVNIDYI